LFAGHQLFLGVLFALHWSFFVLYSMAGVEVGMVKVNGYTTRNVMSFACEFLVFVLTHRCGTQLSSEERHHD
jgi:hypothetical protein